MYSVYWSRDFGQRLPYPVIRTWKPVYGCNEFSNSFYGYTLVLYGTTSSLQLFPHAAFEFPSCTIPQCLRGHRSAALVGVSLKMYFDHTRTIRQNDPQVDIFILPDFLKIFHGQLSPSSI